MKVNMTEAVQSGSEEAGSKLLIAGFLIIPVTAWAQMSEVRQSGFSVSMVTSPFIS